MTSTKALSEILRAARNERELPSETKELERALEIERGLRIEEMYRRENQPKEITDLQSDISKLKSSLSSQSDQVRKIVLENTALKETNNQVLNRNLDLDRQLREYETEIIRLETENCNLRVGLGKVNSEADILRHESSLLLVKKIRYYASGKSVPINKRKNSLSKIRLQPLSSLFFFAYYNINFALGVNAIASLLLLLILISAKLYALFIAKYIYYMIKLKPLGS